MWAHLSMPKLILDYIFSNNISVWMDGSRPGKYFRSQSVFQELLIAR